MGQKINPLGFRLGTTQGHHSLWFSQPKNYSKGLEDDKKIRDFIQNYIQKNMRISSRARVEGIARIEIKKTIDLIQIIIFMGFPLENRPRKIKETIKEFKEKRKEFKIKELEINLKKEFHYVKQKLKIAIKRIAKPYKNAKILAEFIAGQLKDRVSFRKAMKKAIELAEQADTKGIRVQMAGRINGKDIARVEWIRKGRLPLQTIRAKIDYCCYTIRTIYGVMGIKIWIFIDEK
uniref:ribosomal protein S3 n=1 Tax=Chrysojasminum floridum TaxID=485365 RepID=UPI002E783704|nr:ribosomal protein S3 [Chrysojasminum floridum]WPN86963.1 ribosomal protein S3 [Chrysojasminum floridum]